MTRFRFQIDDLEGPFTHDVSPAKRAAPTVEELRAIGGAAVPRFITDDVLDEFARVHGPDGLRQISQQAGEESDGQDIRMAS
jgi:hypothetical protein